MKKVPAGVNLEGPLTDGEGRGGGGCDKQTRELKDTFILIEFVCRMKAVKHRATRSGVSLTLRGTSPSLSV